MLVRFLLKKRLLKWAGVFAIAIVLAIALAQTLNRSEPLTSRNWTPPTPAVTSQEEMAPSILQSQAKYDRTLAHYATVSRSDGSFRQMFVDEKAIAAIQPGEG